MAIELEGKNGQKKLYEQVHERLNRFRETYPINSGWGIVSEIIEDTAQRVAISTKIINPEGVEIANGFAEEVRGSSDVNRTSAMENCETSSLGRALFKAGFGNGEVCSAEELVNALKAQQALKDAKIKAQTGNPPAQPANRSPQPSPAPSASSDKADPKMNPKLVALFKKNGITPVVCDGVYYTYKDGRLMIYGPKTFTNKKKYGAAGFTWDGKALEKGAWCKAVQ